MTPVLIVPFVVMIALIVLGLPIAFALGGAGIIGIWLFSGEWSTVLGLVQTTPYRTVADFVLTTIPMFLLMAFFTSSSGVARDLYTAAANWCSPLRGGLAIASVFASGVFGAMSGATLAAGAVMSKVAIPEMRRHGYSEVLAAGAVSVGSTMDILIPPSVAMVVYGIATETSIGKLLVAGIIPAVIEGFFLSLIIWLWVRFDPKQAPAAATVPWSTRWSSLRGVWPSLVIILSVVTFLYAGVATPSELGALGALASLLLGVFMRRLSLGDAVDAMKSTLRSTAMIFTIIIGAKIFSYFMTFSRIPQAIVATIAALELDRTVVIIAICVTYFVLSMVMDEIPLMLLLLQFTFPVVMALGYDPVWFGVVSMLLISLGLVFPPVGMTAFVVSQTARIDLVTVYRGSCIMMIATIITLALVIAFPEIVLFLPGRMQ